MTNSLKQNLQYQNLRQNLHALYTGRRNPVESESIFLGLKGIIHFDLGVG